MSCPNFSRILCIVVEILRCQGAVLIPQQTIAFYHGRIKLHLKFHIPAYGKQRCGHLFYQHLPRFLQIIYVSIIPVTFIGQDLHFIVLDISCTKTEHGQENAGFLFGRDQIFQLLLAGHPDIQVAVRSQDNTVIAALYKMLLRQRIRRLYPLAPVSAAVRRQSIQRRHDLLRLTAPHPVQHCPGILGIGHDRDPVPACQVLRQKSESLLQKRQLIIRIHGP